MSYIIAITSKVMLSCEGAPIKFSDNLRQIGDAIVLKSGMILGSKAASLAAAYSTEIVHATDIKEDAAKGVIFLDTAEGKLTLALAAIAAGDVFVSIRVADDEAESEEIEEEAEEVEVKAKPVASKKKPRQAEPELDEEIDSDLEVDEDSADDDFEPPKKSAKKSAAAAKPASKKPSKDEEDDEIVEVTDFEL